MTVNELAQYVKCDLEVKRGFNGKILCKKYDLKKHMAIAGREVTAIWSEIRTLNGGGYSSMAKPVVCVYVDGQPEYEKLHKEG